MLKVEGVNQYYGGSHILRNVGFEAKAGEVTVILGRNGVGKTTLLKSLMGVTPIRTGTIALDGASRSTGSPWFTDEATTSYWFGSTIVSSSASAFFRSASVISPFFWWRFTIQWILRAG